MCSPIEKGMFVAVNKYAEDLFLGKITFEEAVDKAFEVFEGIVSSSIFQDKLNEYMEEIEK